MEGVDPIPMPEPEEVVRRQTPPGDGGSVMPCAIGMGQSADVHELQGLGTQRAQAIDVTACSRSTMGGMHLGVWATSRAPQYGRGQRPRAATPSHRLSDEVPYVSDRVVQNLIPSPEDHVSLTSGLFVSGPGFTHLAWSLVALYQRERSGLEPRTPRDRQRPCNDWTGETAQDVAA